MPWRPPDAWSYSYLLGAYLGDGCLWLTQRSASLTITLDAAYPGIVADVHAAVTLTDLPRRVTISPRSDSACVVVRAYSARWPEAFPQHGPGRKHDRQIRLEAWQQRIVDDHPRPFLRGLIDSDGCRTVNRFRTTLPSGRVAEYAYPRYFFSNRSEDIRRLFCAACDRLGIVLTQSSPRNISVARRASVALLDEFAGPKA